jgi:DNA mismatch repair ATPase MutS
VVACLTMSRSGYPSTVVAEINAWQSLVAIAYHREHLRRAVRSKLSLIEDSARTLQNIALGRGVPSDLMNLKDFVEASLAIRDEFRSCMSREDVACDDDAPLPDSTSDWSYIRRLVRDLHDHDALASDIRAAIQEAVGQPTEFRQPEMTKPAGRRAYVRKDKWVMKSACVGTYCVTHGLSPCCRFSDFVNVSCNQELATAHRDLEKAYEDADTLQAKMAHYYGTCRFSVRKSTPRNRSVVPD